MGRRVRLHLRRRGDAVARIATLQMSRGPPEGSKSPIPASTKHRTAPTHPTAGRRFEALCNFRDRGATAAGRALDWPPRLTRGQHAGDSVVALRILRTSLVAASAFAFS